MHREDEEDETSLLFEAMLLLDKLVSSAGAKAKECLTAMAAAKIKKQKYVCDFFSAIVVIII